MICALFFRRKIFSCRFTYLVIIAAYISFAGGPQKIFSQTMPDYFGEGFSGTSRRILDYQFDRADRELTPAEWMEEARTGILSARSVLAETLPEIFSSRETQADFLEWSEEELEKRFTRWLLERFFGAAKEAPSSALFAETGEADKYLVFSTGVDGNILYDSGTGDPKIIRPGDEGYDFTENLSSWGQITEDAAERESRNFGRAVKEMYPELLAYILPGREGEFEKMLAAAGDRAAASLTQEFEAVLAREERYVTAQRLGDVLSLRKKNEDRSAEAIGDVLIEEAREICAGGISAIEAKIEAAKIDGGDMALAGSEWLAEYREQFYRGLDAWESAEERFLVRRVEWEESADKSFREGRETWAAVLSRFEEEKQKWEEKAEILFREGEEFFAQASKDLESTIAAAKLQYEADGRLRTGAASERAGALSNMYILAGSALEEAGKNIEFWVARYRDLQPGAAIPEGNAAIGSWAERELRRQNGEGGGLELIILEEMKNWSALYGTYAAKVEESRGSLMKELSSLTGLRDAQGGGAVSYPDQYETEVIRAEAELDYWKNRNSMAEAVAAYAAALDAGRSTAAESAEAWEKARIAYNDAAARYKDAESSLKATSAGISAARDAMTGAAEKMKAADSALEKLRQNYQILAVSFGKDGSLVLAEEINLLRKELGAEQKILDDTGEDSLWGNFFVRAIEVEERQKEELRKMFLRRLIAGDGESLESLETIAVRTDTRLRLRQAAISLLIENGNISDWYSSVYKNGRDGFPENPTAMETRLLSDWEWDSLELLNARAALELEALDFLEGKQTGEAAAALARLYTGDETTIPRDREALEQVRAMLRSFTGYRAETNAVGTLQDFLVEACCEDERILAFVYGNSLICPQYGTETTQTLLGDYVKKEEFSRDLYTVYTRFGELSPAVARDNLNRALEQLARLWETLGVKTGNTIIPDTASLIKAVHAVGEDDSGLSPFLFILDEIFAPLPSSLDLILGLWKETLNDYYTSPGSGTLALADRHANLLNSALLLLKDREETKTRSDFENEAGWYLEHPLLKWDEDHISPREVTGLDDYKIVMNELQNRYSKEKYMTEEIKRLSDLAELSGRDLSALEREMKAVSAEIAIAEEKCKTLTAEYQTAADNFRRLGTGYDVLYGNVEKEFKNLEAARRVFETRDAVRQWADTAYLDSRRPEGELEFCREKYARAQNVFNLLKSVNTDANISPEYRNALNGYNESLSLLSQSLEALTKLRRAVEAEERINESAYRSYQNQLSVLGANINFEDLRAADMLDFVSVSNGVLGFDKNSREPSPSELQTLRNYFLKDKTIGDEAHMVSSFELSLRRLSSRLASGITSVEQYKTWALARDRNVAEVMWANNYFLTPGGGIWRKTAAALRKDQNLGNMKIPQPYKKKVYEIIESEKERKNIEAAQTNALSSLDITKRRDLDLYTILTILGGGGNNSDSFSRATEYLEYTIALEYADKSYDKVKDLADIFLIGSLFYKDDLKVITATRNALTVSREELENKLNLGYRGLVETLSSFNKKLGAYQNSSARLAGLKGKTGGGVRWGDIENCLRLAGAGQDLRLLKNLWDRVKDKPGAGAQDVLGALRFLADESRAVRDENSQRLYHVWEKGNEERAGYEAAYRELYNAYVSGNADYNDLKAAAGLSFAGSVPSGKKHFGNVGDSLMACLKGLERLGLGGTAEYAGIVHEYAGIVNNAWEEKYAAELVVRENEWESRRRDIREKLALWRESAAIILEDGRAAWKESGEKLRGAFDVWTGTFREEYGRISGQWTAAYLEGLQDKDAWAAAALEAAGKASSEAVLALIGSGAEAGARAMDTRDPAGFMALPDTAEGERILAGLLQKSGTAYLASAFDAVKNSPETFATAVRSGLDGWGIWNSGALVTEASIFARTAREEFEGRESRKMAFTVMETARDAYKMLEDNVRLANESFKKYMDDAFIIEGQWRRAGDKYVKDVITHSTLVDAVIKEHGEIEGYRYFVLPRSRLSFYTNADVPAEMDARKANDLIDSIYSEIDQLGKKVFGSGGEEKDGDFDIHTGTEPVLSSKPDLDKGRSGVIEEPGTGELGRLLGEFYFWMYKERLGVTLVAAAPWDKPIWDSRHSALQAPTLRSAVDLAVKTGIVIAGAAGAPLTMGTSVIGSIALSAALNSADDLLFGAMDVSGGYKSWGEAGFDFGKGLVMNTVNSAAGSLFFGMDKAASSFFNTGGISGLISGAGFGGAVSGALTGGLHSLSGGAVNGLLGSINYNDENGFEFSGGTFIESLKGAGVGALSGMTGSFTGGILDLGLTGLTGDVFSSGHILSGFAGNLASQGVNYAFGDDFVFNILNAGILFGKDINAGILEMSLGRDGLAFELGSGGVNVSPGTVMDALKGLEAWKVNAEILFSGEADARKNASLLRTLYSGGTINKNEYENILAGKTKIIKTGESYSQSIFDKDSGIKTIYLGTGAVDKGSPFALNAIISHESYRDGIDSGEAGQAAELAAAIIGHNETVKELYAVYGAGSLGEAMLNEAKLYERAVQNGYGSIVELLMTGYDNSADYWKLVRDEQDGLKWIDDKSADFDVSILLNDPDFWKARGHEQALGLLTEEIFNSVIIDGKEEGIISAGRMRSDVISALGKTVALGEMYKMRGYGTRYKTISVPGLEPTPVWYAVVNDTLNKVVYNNAHTTTVMDSRNRPVTLHNMDTENAGVKDLLTQHSGALGHIENMSDSGCNFMDIISIPQILTRQTLGAGEVTDLWNSAVENNIMDREGLVTGRNALVNLALEKLGVTNFGIDLEGAAPKNSKLAGYRVRVPYGTGGHFVLTGTNKALVYNPGNTFTSDQSKWKGIVEISIYGR